MLVTHFSFLVTFLSILHLELFTLLELLLVTLTFAALVRVRLVFLDPTGIKFSIFVYTVKNSIGTRRLYLSVWYQETLFICIRTTTNIDSEIYLSFPLALIPEVPVVDYSYPVGGGHFSEIL